MVNSPDNQVYQELLQNNDPKLQAIWKEIEDIVNDSKNEHDDKIDFSGKFDIKPEDANKIIEYIDNLLRMQEWANNPDLKMLKTHLRGSAHPNYTMPNPDSGFSDIRINVNKDQQNQIKEISKNIKSILRFLDKNKITGPTNLRESLTNIQDILKDRDNISRREMAQIAWLIGLDPNFDDETLFDGLSKFIESTKDNITMTEEFRQSENEFKGFYDACINGQYSELYKFSSDKDVNKIKFFVEYNPWKWEIQDLYLKMKEINAKWFNNIESWAKFYPQDKLAFNKVFAVLKDQYENNNESNNNEYKEQVQKRFLDNHFTETERLNGRSLSNFCEKVLWMEWWEWKELKGNTEYDEILKKYCESWRDSFTVEELKDKIDEKNNERKDKNKEALKSKIKITEIINDNLLSKLNIKEEGGNKKILYEKEWGEIKELSADDFLQELGLRGGIAAEGIDFLGNELEEAIQGLQGDWYKEVISYIENSKEKKEDGEGSKAEEEAQQPEFESLDDITLPEKFLFNGISKEDITGALDKAKWNLENYWESDKAEYTERIKMVISAIKEPWDKGKNGWWGRIETLQNTMNKELNPSKPLKPDWKLWKHTFNAIKDYLWITTRWESLINQWGLTTEQEKIANLIDDPEKVDELRNLLRVGDEADVNEAAFNLLKNDKSRDYLKWYIGDKNFPWKKTVTDLLNATWQDKKTQLTALQLQLVPYYKWNIDWLIGPMTLAAIEEYVGWHTKSDDSENDNSIEKKNNNITRYNSNEKEITNWEGIDRVIDKNENHVYFVNWADFSYERDVPTSNLKIKVKNTRDEKMEDYLYTAKGLMQKVNDPTWSYNVDNKWHKQFKDNADFIQNVLC